jgi:hypothetical protein
MRGSEHGSISRFRELEVGTPSHGKIAVTALDGELTLTRMGLKGDRAALVAANPRLSADHAHRRGGADRLGCSDRGGSRLVSA